MKPRQLNQIIGFNILRLCVGTVILILIIILYDITTKGIGVMNWTFLTSMPKNGMTEGGILPAIVGTFFVTIITALLSIPLGMGCAIYLNEYARDSKITRVIRMAIRAGLPILAERFKVKEEKANPESKHPSA